MKGQAIPIRKEMHWQLSWTRKQLQCPEQGCWVGKTGPRPGSWPRILEVGSVPHKCSFKFLSTVLILYLDDKLINIFLPTLL